MKQDPSRRQLVSGLLASALATRLSAASPASVTARALAAPGGSPAPGTAAAAGTAARTLVIGATGRLGRLIVGELHARGDAVRGLARDAARAGAAFPGGVEIAVGDLRDPASLAAALADVSHVVFAASASGGGVGENTPENVDYGGVAALLRVLGERRLRQFLLISSAAVTQRLHPHNLWKDILLWKFRSEELLRASGQPYTILRPCGLRSYPGGARSIQCAQGDHFAFGYVIARDDAARVCAAAVAAPAALRKTFEAYNDDAPAAALEAQFAALHEDPAASAA
ncbi:MAG: NAD(P)H-binding protein [Steroidobacteraceae bacterium]